MTPARRAKRRQTDNRRRAMIKQKQFAESKRAWSARNREKKRVHWIIAMALRHGIITYPGNCQHCQQSARVEAHHADYSRPLEVVWLCRKCHGQTHRKDPPELQPDFNPPVDQTKEVRQNALRCYDLLAK